MVPFPAGGATIRHFLPRHHPVQISYNYAWWYGTQAWRVHERLLVNTVFYGDPPLDPHTMYPKDRAAFVQFIREQNKDVTFGRPEKEFWIDLRRVTNLFRTADSLPEWDGRARTRRRNISLIAEAVPPAEGAPSSTDPTVMCK